MEENKKQSIIKNKYGDLNSLGIVITLSIAICIILIIIAGFMYTIPKYKVWAQKLNGEAKLKEAKYSKQIGIEEAKANLESEKLNAEAEIERAKGMAKAMEIENGKLTNNYIKYLWVKNMNNSKNTKIYVPTEAGLPILEAK